jgi:RimJ/RimL family protein N-acetyltransferase
MKQGFLVRPDEAFVILDKSSGKVIGTFDNLPNKDYTMIEISYSLLPSYQGIGLMSEVLNNMTHHIIQYNSKVTTLSADVLIENKSSIKFLEKNGFIRMSDSYINLHDKPKLSGKFWHYEKNLR